jgi:LPS-assembly lipoprotein
MQRRAFASSLVVLASAGGLAGCGFHLRQAPNFAFSSIYLATNSSFGIELRRNLESGGKITVIRDVAQRDTAQVILEVLQDQRERVVLGYNSAGQVREFQLRIRVRFRLRSPDDRELLAPTEILMQQDQSYDETLALAKEAEAQLIYRSMQTDVVQQIMRRLAAVKQI